MRPLGPWTHMETLFVRIDTDAGWVGWGEAFPIFPHRKIGHSPQNPRRDYCDDSILG